MGIAVGGIHPDCPTHSPVPMRMQDFRALGGRALLRHGYSAVLGPLTGLNSRRCCMPARFPAARVARDTLKAEFLDRLAFALPVDGVYLAMHRAMKVEVLWDAGGDWIGAGREWVGPDGPTAASYDLHGNLSQQIIDAIGIFAADRAAPQVDGTATAEAALAMPIRAQESSKRPGVVRVALPLLLPGKTSSTDKEPARPLVRRWRCRRGRMSGGRRATPLALARSQVRRTGS